MVGRDVHPGPRGGTGNGLELLLVHVRERVPVGRAVRSHVAHRHAARRRVGEDRFHVVVEVLDLLSGGQCRRHAHPGIDVTRHPHAGGAGLGHDRGVDLGRDVGGELDEVVTGGLRRADGGAGLGGVLHQQRVGAGITGELRRGDPEARARDGALAHAALELEVLRPTDLQSRRGRSQRQVEAELGRCRRLGRVLVGEEVRVHVGEAGHQEQPAPVDAPGVTGDRCGAGGPHRRDAPAAHDDRGVPERAVAGHGEHGDAGDGEWFRVGARGRRQDTHTGCGRQQQGGGDKHR